MFNPPVSRRPARLPRLLFAMLAVASSALCAQTSLSTTIDQFLRTQTQGLPGKVSYSVGALEQRAQLGACDAFEPFLPPGSRLWGKATVGVRCLGPTAWTVYVPVQVRISGTYLVTARQLAPGQVVSSADLLSQSGDLGALPASVVTDPAQAIGKTGAGFTISNEGKALNNATDGQIAQVRTASGQVVSGIARSGGVVEVSY